MAHDEYHRTKIGFETSERLHIVVFSYFPSSYAGDRLASSRQMIGAYGLGSPASFHAGSGFGEAALKNYSCGVKLL